MVNKTTQISSVQLNKTLSAFCILCPSLKAKSLSVPICSPLFLLLPTSPPFSSGYCHTIVCVLHIPSPSFIQPNLPPTTPQTSKLIEQNRNRDMDTWFLFNGYMSLDKINSLWIRYLQDVHTDRTRSYFWAIKDSLQFIVVAKIIDCILQHERLSSSIITETRFYSLSLCPAKALKFPIFFITDYVHVTKLHLTICKARSIEYGFWTSSPKEGSGNEVFFLFPASQNMDVTTGTPEATLRQDVTLEKGGGHRGKQNRKLGMGSLTTLWSCHTNSIFEVSLNERELIIYHVKVFFIFSFI